MKKQIRYGVFETNSSSQHSLTIMNEKEYEQYLSDASNPDMYWSITSEKYVDKNDVVKRFDELLDHGLIGRYSNDKYEDFNDDEKVAWMIDRHGGYCKDDEECSEVITKEVYFGDGTVKYAVSRYTPDY